MAAKTSWHRYGSKLRHCHPMYCRVAPETDLQNILRQSYDYLTIMSKLRSTYDGRIIFYKTFYEECKDFLRYDSIAKSYDIPKTNLSTV